MRTYTITLTELELNRLLSVVQFHNARRFLDAQDTPALWPTVEKALDESIVSKLTSVESSIWTEREQHPFTSLRGDLEV